MDIIINLCLSLNISLAEMSFNWTEGMGGYVQN